MELTTALVVCVGMTVFGMTICSVFRTLKPKPATPPFKKDRFTLIEEELERLHDELGNYGAGDEEFEMLMSQISKLNDALAQKE